MQKPKSNLKISMQNLNGIFKELEFRKVGTPYINTRTGETTTKITVLDEADDEMYDITVVGEVTEGIYKKGQIVEFENCIIAFSASGKKGFGENSVDGILNVNIRAEKMKVVIKDENLFPNEKPQQGVKENEKEQKK